MPIIQARGSGSSLSVVGVVLLLAAITTLIVFFTGTFNLKEANALTASGGAMALGLILVAAGLFARLRETHEARALDAEFAMAEQEIQAALELSDDLEKRFRAAGIERSTRE